MQVVPVAGQDSMLLNLSGAHGPYFTRNVVISDDNAAAWESAKFREASSSVDLEDAKPLVIGQSIGPYRQVLSHVARLSRSATPQGAASRPSINASAFM